MPDPLLEELRSEVPNTQVSNSFAIALRDQTPRSKASFYKSLRALSEKFKNKKIELVTGSYGYKDVDQSLDRNTIRIFLTIAPKFNSESIYVSGQMPDNMLDDGKFVHGKTVLLINGSWATLTKGQRGTMLFNDGNAGRKELAAKYDVNRIKSENAVDLGFAVHNQIFIFMNLLDSKSNAGEIFSYIVDKALGVMSFEFANGLNPEQIAEHIYTLKSSGYRAELQRTEQEVHALEEAQKQTLNQYTSQVRSYETMAMKATALRACQENKGNTISQIAKEVKSHIDQKKYMEFYIERDRNGVPILCGVTNRIFAVYNNIVYDFEYYTVKIVLGSALNINGIKFDHPRLNHRGYVHPHAGNDQICWGAVQTQVAKLCGQGDIMAILDMCYFFLQSYNQVSPYVKIQEFEGLKSQPLSDFKKRPQPTESEYKEYQASIPIPVAPEPTTVLSGAPIGSSDDDLVCEGCGEAEFSCVCDSEHPLIPRGEYA